MLITPVKILIATALLALYAAYTAWMAVAEHSWVYGLLAVVAIVACVGVALLKRWSQYIVYLLAAAVIGTWSYSIYYAARAGYFSLFASSEQIAKSLAPEILLIVLSCYCVYAVFTQFRARGTFGRNSPGDSQSAG